VPEYSNGTVMQCELIPKLRRRDGSGRRRATSKNNPNLKPSL
jgi:hypothetical protein